MLCGGCGQRFGGQDKSLIEWRYHPLVWHTATRLRTPVDTLLLSCNRNAERYRALLGCDVVGDKIVDFAGPLAGVLAALDLCRTRLPLICPVDAQLLPLELAALVGGARLAVAHDGHRRQNLFFLMHTALRPPRRRYCLEQRRSQVEAWLEATGADDERAQGGGVATAAMRQPGQSPFFNCNDPQALRRLELETAQPWGTRPSRT